MLYVEPAARPHDKEPPDLPLQSHGSDEPYRLGPLLSSEALVWREFLKFPCALVGPELESQFLDQTDRVAVKRDQEHSAGSLHQ